jgi:hypothetical protein
MLVIAFERVEAAEPAMLEAAKEALVHLDAPPGSGSGRPPRCVISAARTAQFWQRRTNVWRRVTSPGTGGKATKKHESRSPGTVIRPLQ